MEMVILYTFSENDWFLRCVYPLNKQNQFCRNPLLHNIGINSSFFLIFFVFENYCRFFTIDL